jgi:hypothetical protein
MACRAAGSAAGVPGWHQHHGVSVPSARARIQPAVCEAERRTTRLLGFETGG